MALSFQAVEKAFKVFNDLGLKDIHSFTPDFEDCDDRERNNPVEQKNYGYSEKRDGGWENLFFFIKNPSQEFVEKWNALKGTVPNSSFMGMYKMNPTYTQFGWF